MKVGADARFAFKGTPADTENVTGQSRAVRESRDRPVRRRYRRSSRLRDILSALGWPVGLLASAAVHRKMKNIIPRLWPFLKRDSR